MASQLSHVPSFRPGESFGGLLRRTLLLYQEIPHRQFVRGILGYTGPETTPRLSFDLRLPPLALVHELAKATYDANKEVNSSFEAYEASCLQRTLWPLVQGLGLNPEEALHDRLLASQGQVCPACLQLGPNKGFRKAAWHVGAVTLCLEHERPILLVERCPRGSPLTDDSLGYRLPRYEKYHAKTVYCGGCDLGATVTTVLDDPLGTVAQEIIQAKLTLREDRVSQEASTALTETACALPRREFWSLLHAYVLLAAYAVRHAPEFVHDPLGRVPDVKLRWPGPSLLVGGPYDMHSLVTTAVSWLRAGGDHLDSLMRVLIKNHVATTKDFGVQPAFLWETVAPNQLFKDMLTTHLQKVLRTWVPLTSIALERPEIGLQAYRLEVEAQRLGITVWRGGYPDTNSVNGKYVGESDAATLRSVPLICTRSRCTYDAVAGDEVQGAYLYCDSHFQSARDTAGTRRNARWRTAGSG